MSRQATTEPSVKTPLGDAAIEGSQHSWLNLFTPKLLTVLKEGYGLQQLRADAIAGLTVAIVALPLSMAIAIASGVSPAQGLYTAIVGGFLVSALGGSRFQIGGPAGAFIVLVGTTVQVHGVDGLILATIISGVILVLAGVLRLGTYVKFIPYPVTVGFTAGIGVIIFTSQLKDLFGLTLAGPEPGPLLMKVPVLWSNLPSINPTAAAVSIATIVAIVSLSRKMPRWPGMLIAVVAGAAVTAIFNLPVATIGTRFGGIPASLPLPVLPEISLAKIQAVLPSAAAFALLGSIESLLSAVVADSMTGRRHRSNCELVGQGISNIASGLFSGFCVTGTIARTATNIRSGAHGPIAGMLHSVFMLLFVILAAPLATFIPLASLAGVLVVVAWAMFERHAFASLLRASNGDAAVLLVTFLLTIFRDLTEAIIVGFALGSVLFIHRMSKVTAIRLHTPLVEDDRADDANGKRTRYDEVAASDPDVIVYRITGAFFFGAAASIGLVLDRTADTHRALVLDLSAVPFLDSTAAKTIEGLAHNAAKRGKRITLTGVSREVQRELSTNGVKPPLVQYELDIDAALGKIRATHAAGPNSALE